MLSYKEVELGWLVLPGLRCDDLWRRWMREEGEERSLVAFLMSVETGKQALVGSIIDLVKFQVWAFWIYIMAQMKSA